MKEICLCGFSWGDVNTGELAAPRQYFEPPFARLAKALAAALLAAAMDSAVPQG